MRRHLCLTSACLIGLGFCVGCPGRFEEPQLSASIRRAPICTGATTAAEQQAIDELAEALHQSGRGMLCTSGEYPPEAAAAFAATGVTFKYDRDGRFVVVDPSVAVTVYEWNADSTALVETAHSEAPRELNPCPDGLAWSGGWGYWRRDGRVEVVIECGRPDAGRQLPRLIFDPASSVWEVDTFAGNVYTSWYSNEPLRNLVVDGKVQAPDGNFYPVAFDTVYRVTPRFALAADQFAIQSLRTGTVHEFSALAFVNPSGTRLAVHDAGAIRVYDLTEDELVELIRIDTPPLFERLLGFPGDRILVATAASQPRRVWLFLPVVTLRNVIIDAETGSFFDANDGWSNSNDGFFSTRTGAPTTP
jgi:hypothetical protein